MCRCSDHTTRTFGFDKPDPEPPAARSDSSHARRSARYRGPCGCSAIAAIGHRRRTPAPATGGRRAHRQRSDSVRFRSSRTGVPTRNSVREGTASGRGRSALPVRGPQNPRHAVPANPDDCGRVWRDHRGRASSGGTLSAARIATIRRRDVRSDGANRRGAGPGRSCRRSAVVPPAEQADPCPARGACATRDCRPGTAGGGGAATARSTR